MLQVDRALMELNSIQTEKLAARGLANDAESISKARIAFDQVLTDGETG